MTSASAPRKRPFDIVVWGATGFTGALVVEYLVVHAQANGIRFAASGRNKAKIESVLERVADRTKIKSDIGVIIADSDDQESLDQMVVQTKVVITTVGPYAKYGAKLVDACVRMKTDYVDLTGEPTFVRAMAEQYHEQAVKNNVLIVHACGYDSIPADLGVLMIAKLFKSKGLKTEETKLSVVDGYGGVSGGTIASGAEIMKQNSFKELYSMSSNYNYAIPETTEVIASKTVRMHYDDDLKAWQTVSPMEMPNSRIVYRDRWLLGYGPKFSFIETTKCPGPIAATAIYCASNVAMLGLLFPPSRMLLQYMVPPGSGPSEKTMKDGYFKIEVIGRSSPDPTTGKVYVAKAKINGIQDPGYAETAKMISESALCLALSRAEMTTASAKVNTAKEFKLHTGGVLSTAAAMGMFLVERLRRAGMTFEVEEI